MNFEQQALAMTTWAQHAVTRWAGVELSEVVQRALVETPRHVYTAAPPAVAYASEETFTPPLPADQPVSQVPVVAYLADQAGSGPGTRILEIGTGSGYQAAVMASTGAVVFTIESRPEVAAECQPPPPRDHPPATN